ncbi:hypothetical protein [Amycolatopsis nalaikhensis]|uniref:hypothetical protein n=1 Tax=Amycolatopsis nalaikhensis TaxID=715472 RepID=UPI00331C1BF9
MSVPMWGPDAKDPLEVCRPLAVEVHRIPDELREGWRPPEPAAYRNLHGMRQPSWDDRA